MYNTAVDILICKVNASQLTTITARGAPALSSHPHPTPPPIPTLGDQSGLNVEVVLNLKQYNAGVVHNLWSSSKWS